MDPIGKSPVPVTILVLGKTCMALCLLLPLLKQRLGGALVYDSLLTEQLGILLGVAGLAFVVLGFVYLGRSLSVGLPEEATELKTRGIYRITRNPLYLGGFMACVGSCLYSPLIVNFLLCMITIGIHHRIILKEERFLEARFGQQWLDYSGKVPRYLGRTGGA